MTNLAPANEEADLAAERWLKDNDALVIFLARKKANGDQDAAQEARIAVLDAFRRELWDPTKGTLDKYMRGVVHRALQRLNLGFPETGESRSGMCALAPKKVKVDGKQVRVARTELVDFAFSTGEGLRDPGFSEPGYDEVEASSLVASIKADIAAGMDPREACLKHGLTPPREDPLPKGITRKRTRGSKAARYVVYVRRGDVRRSGTFKTRREAEVFLDSLPAGRPAGRPKAVAA